MFKIVIPANQVANQGENVLVIQGDTPLLIPSLTDTFTASYDEVFYQNEFNRSVHGFRGINDTLEYWFNDQKTFESQTPVNNNIFTYKWRMPNGLIVKTIHLLIDKDGTEQIQLLNDLKASYDKSTAFSTDSV